MQTIGLIGGMSWESTAVYYRIINETVKAERGGLHSARVVLVSVDFAEIEACQAAGDWETAGVFLAAAARQVAMAGADFLVLCTNTMHRVAAAIEDAVTIPLLHIADATAEAIRRHGIPVVGLLGTRYTMEQDFYRGRLEERHGLEVVVPDDRDREIVDSVIYRELCLGEVKESSRQRFQEVIQRLVARGAGGVILGCTEIGLLVRAEDAPVPLFDTAEIHARAAARRSLKAVRRQDGSEDRL